jgi:hypothetical protein
MKDRKMVEVNEEALRQIMATGKEPYLTDGIIKSVRNEPELSAGNETECETVSEQPKAENPVSDVEAGKGQKKRKNTRADFSELYLKERVIKNRKPVYISVDVYNTIQRYLKYIGDVSFIAYVDNILVQHIEDNKDAINELFEKRVNKPF